MKRQKVKQKEEVGLVSRIFAPKRKLETDVRLERTKIENISSG